MEPSLPDHSAPAAHPQVNAPQEKQPPGKSTREYLADALLIVFSVLLALILNEIRNNWQEKRHTRQLLANLRTELQNNKRLLEEQYRYHTGVLRNIDSALVHEPYRNLIFSDDKIHLQVMAKEGVGLADFDQTAWEIAKANNIVSKIDMETMSLLNNIARQHSRIEKIEDEVAKVIFAPGSRKKENARETLLLMSYAYHGWAVDRTPGLLKSYELAIQKLEK
jgi:hypothetical protein